MPPFASILPDQLGVEPPDMEPPDIEPPDIEPLDDEPPRERPRARPEPLVVVELSGIVAVPLPFDMLSPDIEPLAVPPFDIVPPDIVPPVLMSPDVPAPGIVVDGDVEGIDVPIDPPADELEVVPPPAGGWEIAAAGRRAIVAAIRIVRIG